MTTQREYSPEEIAAQWEESRRQLVEYIAPIKAAWEQIRVAFQDAWESIQIALYGAVPGAEVPEVWEAFSLSRLKEPRPAYDPEHPEDPKYLAAVRERAEDVTRYLVAVARQRGMEP